MGVRLIVLADAQGGYVHVILAALLFLTLILAPPLRRSGPP